MLCHKYHIALFTNQGLNSRGVTWGLVFLDFRKLVFLDHRNFGVISRDLHFYCIFKVQFCQIFLKVKFFLEWILIFLKILEILHIFSCFKKFRRLRHRKLIFLGDFCPKFWSFWILRSPPFWQVTPPIEALVHNH